MNQEKYSKIDEGRKGLNFAINIQKIPGIYKFK